MNIRREISMTGFTAAGVVPVVTRAKGPGKAAALTSRMSRKLSWKGSGMSRNWEWE